MANKTGVRKKRSSSTSKRQLKKLEASNATSETYAEPLTMVTIESPGLCCCCLELTSLKNLWGKYECSGLDEVYGVMLEECFSLHFPKKNDNGGVERICEVCIKQLRDASSFKQQVLSCQTRLHRLDTDVIKTESNEDNESSENLFIKIEPEFDTDQHKATDIDIKLEPKKLESNEKNRKAANQASGKPIKKQVRKRAVKDPPDKQPTSQWYRLTTEDYRKQGDIYTCNYCDKPFKTTRSLQQHIKFLHLKQRYICHCKQTFSSTMKFVKHKLEEHGVDGRVTCGVCDSKFWANKFLKKHLRKHEVKVEAKKKVDSPRKISTIRKDRDYKSEGNLYVCLHCGFKSKSIRRHILNAHLNTSPYTCQYCKNTFQTPSVFMTHKLEEHKVDDRLPCNACDRKFSNKCSLRKHKDAFHLLGVKKKCKFCPYETFWANVLRNHMAKHKTTKDFKCRFCSKAFMRSGTLIFHERIHTGDKRKICKECGQAFVQKASLNYHMTKYHPEVPF